MRHPREPLECHLPGCRSRTVFTGMLLLTKRLSRIPLSRPSRPTKHSPEAVRSAPPAALWHISTRGVFLETIAATIAAVMVIFHTRLHQLDRLLQRPCSNYKESRCAARRQAKRRRRRRERGRAAKRDASPPCHFRIAAKWHEVAERL